MDKKEQLNFFSTYKEEKIDFETLLESIFLEFIQENENKELYSKH